MFDRYAQLNNPVRVSLAKDIAKLAMAEQALTGKAVLHMTAWDIASTLSVDVQEVRLALRLSYTAEFRKAEGFGFIAPGSGRDGRIYGYVLQNTGSTANAPEQEKALERQGEVHLDHLRGIQEHYTELSLALGRKTKRGREAKMAAHLAEAAADAIELLLP